MTRILIAGSSGMVGSLILKEAIASNTVREIILLNRTSAKKLPEKVKEVIHADFENFDGLENDFSNISAAFFCIGVYTGKVDRDRFRKINIDLPVSFGRFLKSNSPNARFCFLSGAGADRTEKSRIAFAKDKGIAENKLSAMDFRGFHSFRPGYIYPVTKREEPNFSYQLMRYLYPLLRIFGKNASIKSTELAKAMVKVGLEGGESEIYENREIRELIAP